MAGPERAGLLRSAQPNPTGGQGHRWEREWQYEYVNAERAKVAYVRGEEKRERERIPPPECQKRGSFKILHHEYML